MFSKKKINKSASISEGSSYKEIIQGFYLSHDKLPKLIDSDSILSNSVEDTYVLPDLELVKDGENIKISHDMFFNPRGEIYPFEKLLMIGALGVGKTSFLQNIAYRWAKNEIYKNIKYIFRVDLRLFSTDIEYIRDLYAGDEMRNNPLECLIAYFFYKNNLSIDPDIIIGMINEDKDRVLLLVDATDLNIENPIVKKILDSSLEFKNSIVITRPDVVDQAVKDNFAEIITISGFGAKKKEEYIEKFFASQTRKIQKYIEELDQEFGASLNRARFTAIVTSNHEYKERLLDRCKKEKRPGKKELAIRFIEISSEINGDSINDLKVSIERYYEGSRNLALQIKENSNLGSLLFLPMTMNMLCIVLSLPKSRELIQNNVTLGNLFKELMVLLAKRVIDASIDYEGVLSSDEFRILTSLAYYAAANHNQIEGSKVKELIKKFNLNYGKIKDIQIVKKTTPGELTKSNLSNHNFAFSSLVAQNFLAAWELKEMLKSGAEQEKVEAINFIASHRNEEKFLLTFKFIVDFLSSEAAKSEENAIIAFREVWFALSSNIDGLLELGEDTKVTMFMHLLASCNAEVIEYIPNIDTIKLFIERIVLNDLSKWSSTIKKSGYLPFSIQEKIGKQLSDIEEVKSNVHQSLELLTILYDWLEVFGISCTLDYLSQHENNKIREIVIKIYSKMISSGKINLENEYKDIKKIASEVINLAVIPELSDVVSENLELISRIDSILHNYIIENLIDKVKEKNIGNLKIVISDLTTQDYLLETYSKLYNFIIDVPPKRERSMEDKNIWKNCNQIFAELVTRPDLSQNIIKEFYQRMEDMVEQCHKEQNSSNKKRLENLIYSIILIINLSEKDEKNKIISKIIEVETLSYYRVELFSRIEMDKVDGEILVRLLLKLVDEDSPEAISAINKILESEPSLEIELADVFLTKLLGAVISNHIYDKATWLSIIHLSKIFVKDDDKIERIFNLLSNPGVIERSYEEFIKFSRLDFSAHNRESFLRTIEQILEDGQHQNRWSFYFLPLINLIEENDQGLIKVKDQLIFYILTQKPNAEIKKSILKISSISETLQIELFNSLIEQYAIIKIDDKREYIYDLLLNTAGSFEDFKKISEIRSDFNVDVKSISLARELIRKIKLSSEEEDYAQEFLNKYFSSVVDNLEQKSINELVELLKLGFKPNEMLAKALLSKISYDSLNIFELFIKGDLLLLIQDIEGIKKIFFELVKIDPQFYNDLPMENLICQLSNFIDMDEYIKYLDDENSEKRSLCAKIIESYLSTFTNNNLLEIISMLNILKYNLYDMDKDYKKQLFNIINKKINLIMALRADDIVIEATDKIEQILDSNLEDGLNFIKTLLHHVFSDKKITSSESKFIYQCITVVDLSLTIKIPKITKEKIIVFSISFDGKTYSFEGYNNLIYMDAFVDAAFKANKNIFANQYNGENALFPNDSKLLRKAAVDSDSCSSIVWQDKELSNNEWVLSYLYKSTHTKSSPSEIMVIIERRSPLVGYVLDVITLRGEGLIREHYIKHPEDVTTDFRKEIFKEMIYVASPINPEKPRYFGKSIDIDPKVGSKIIREIKDPTMSMNSLRASTSVDDIEESSANSFSMFNLVRQGSPPKRFKSPIIEHIENEGNFNSKFSEIIDKIGYKDLLIGSGITGEWSHDKKIFTELKKSILYRERGYSTESLKITNIEHEIRISAMEISLDEMKNKYNIDLEVLHDMVQRKSKKKNELNRIESDEYKTSFYKALRIELNSVYIAASAINSGLVNGKSDNVYSKIGDVLNAISSHTPLVGVGIALIAEVLGGIGEYKQEQNLGNYQNLVADSVEMAKLAEKIARRLALEDFTPNEAIVSGEVLLDMVDEVAHVTIPSVIKQVCKQFNEHLEATQDVKYSSSVPDNISEFANKFFAGPEETQESRGVKNAKIVAKFIIKNAYLGLYESLHNTGHRFLSRANPLTEIADGIARDVLDKFSGNLQSHEPEETKSGEMVAGSDAQDSQNNKTPSKFHCLFPWIYCVTKAEYENQVFVANYDKIINVATKILNEKEMEILTEFLKDDDVVEILSEGDRKQIQKNIEVIFDKQPRDELMDSFNKIKEFIGDNIYLFNLHKSLISKSQVLHDLLKKAASYVEYIQQLVNQEVVGDKLLAAIEQFEELLNYQGSLNAPKIPFYRPPNFDPDDSYFGGGSGDDGKSGKNNSLGEYPDNDLVLLMSGNYSITNLDA